MDEEIAKMVKINYQDYLICEGSDKSLFAGH